MQKAAAMSAGASPKDSTQVEAEAVEKSDSSVMRPGTDRHCTDVAWVYIFLLANILLGYFLYLANSCGIASRLVIFRDFKGDECGVGDHIDKPFLFICKRGSGELAMEFPICISNCPNTSATQHLCYVNETKTFELVNDYPTYQVSGMACGAHDKGLRSQQRQWVADHAGVVTKTLLMLHVWRPVAISVAIAITASVFYLFMLSACATKLVWIGLWTLSVVPTLWGMVLLNWWYIGTFKNGLFYGSLLVMTGSSFLCLTCCAKYNLDKASFIVELSCKCVTSLPILRFSPLLLLATKYAYLTFTIRGIIQLYSLGFSNRVVGRPTYDPTVVSVGMLYCVFMAIWAKTFFDSFWDTFLAYLTRFWYINGGVHSEVKWSWAQADEATWKICRYHFGTMVFGSLVVGFVQPVRLLIGVLTVPARRATRFPLGSLFAESCCCSWLVDLYHNRLELLSNNTFMEVAMSGASFWPAARTSLELTRKDELWMLLNGATWFLKLAGIGLVMILGNVWAYYAFNSCMSAFIMGNLAPVSPWDQDDVGAYVTLCTWTSGLTALPFMLLFDTVSHTILYCHLTAKRLQPANEARSYLHDLTYYIWGMMSMGCGGQRVKRTGSRGVAPKQGCCGRMVRAYPMLIQEDDDVSDSSSSCGTTCSWESSCEDGLAETAVTPSVDSFSGHAPHANLGAVLPLPRAKFQAAAVQPGAAQLLAPSASAHQATGPARRVAPQASPLQGQASPAATGSALRVAPQASTPQGQVPAVVATGLPRHSFATVQMQPLPMAAPRACRDSVPRL